MAYLTHRCQSRTFTCNFSCRHRRSISVSIRNYCRKCFQQKQTQSGISPIQENPVLKKTFGEHKTNRLAAWLERKWPGIISNFWFGVFMGSTYPIGIFLGLNLDIRHITFVSGNIALGAYGADFALTGIVWFWSFLGIFFVGFMNFIVSFSLSLGLAFRSRNIPWTEIFVLQKSVWRHFKKYPMHFIYPPKQKKGDL